MFQENELITAIVVLGIFVFLFANRRRIERNPSDTWLIASFVFYAIASVVTVTETFFLPTVSNLVEHLCILLHTVFFTAWIWRLTQRTDHNA
jgi:uncharacterized membrane protein YesL